MAIGDKLKERRKKRKAEDKWVLGEKLTGAGRERAQRRKATKYLAKHPVGKAGKKGSIEKKTVFAPSEKAAHKKALGTKQKLRKKPTSITVTKGGIYPGYGPKSAKKGTPATKEHGGSKGQPARKGNPKAAASFRKAFKKNCGSSESGSFNWDGRSYSCKRAQPTKKQKLARISKAAKKMPTGSS